jgi:hypothetical protein
VSGTKAPIGCHSRCLSNLVTSLIQQPFPGWIASTGNVKLPHMPRINRGMVYLDACLIAGIRLARERQVNIRVVPTGLAIDESADLAHEIFNRVFRKVPERVNGG